MLKKNYPASADKIDFCANKIFYAKKVSSEFVSKHFSGVSTALDEIQGGVKDSMKTYIDFLQRFVAFIFLPFLMAFEAVDRFYNSSKGSVESFAKSKIDTSKTYADSAYAYATQVVFVTIPETVVPLLQLFLKRARPYVIQIVSSSRPYVERMSSIAIPIVDRTLPLVEPYIQQSIRVIKCE